MLKKRAAIHNLIWPNSISRRVKFTNRLVEHPPRLLRRLYKDALWRVAPEGHKAVYLTFDDGPCPETTPFILDTLKDYGFKGTFFVVGENAVRYPELMDAIKIQGHSVGNHTMHHFHNPGNRKEEYLADVAAHEAHMPGNLFRPPHGILSMALYRELKKRYRIVMFDIVTRDYDSEVNTSRILDTVKRYSRDGSIIVFHDSLKAVPRILEALPLTLEWLKSEGYEGRAL